MLLYALAAFGAGGLLKDAVSVKFLTQLMEKLRAEVEK